LRRRWTRGHRNLSARSRQWSSAWPTGYLGSREEYLRDFKT
jgi:hypothetical protein